jgi:hypothetical protein
MSLVGEKPFFRRWGGFGRLFSRQSHQNGTAPLYNTAIYLPKTNTLILKNIIKNHAIYYLRFDTIMCVISHKNGGLSSILFAGCTVLEYYYPAFFAMICVEFRAFHPEHGSRQNTKDIRDTDRVLNPSPVNTHTHRQIALNHFLPALQAINASLKLHICRESTRVSRPWLFIGATDKKQ